MKIWFRIFFLSSCLFRFLFIVMDGGSSFFLGYGKVEEGMKIFLMEKKKKKKDFFGFWLDEKRLEIRGEGYLRLVLEIEFWLFVFYYRILRVMARVFEMDNRILGEEI